MNNRAQTPNDDVVETPVLDRMIEQVKRQFWPWLLKLDRKRSEGRGKSEPYAVRLDLYVWEAIREFPVNEVMDVLSELYLVKDPARHISFDGENSRVFGDPETPSDHLSDFLAYIVLSRLTSVEAAEGVDRAHE